MATFVSLLFEYAKEGSGLTLIQKIQVPEDKRIIITTDSSIIDCDFRNWREGYNSRPDYTEGIYEYNIKGNELYVKIVCGVSLGDNLPEDIDIDIKQFPNNEVYLASGESSSLTDFGQVPSWLTSSDYTYPEKQKLAVEAVLIWREKLLFWNRMALDYLHLMDDLGNHLGRILSRADAVIKQFFQDPNIDPLIARQIALEAANGPSTINEPLEMFRNLRVMATAYPDGFPFAAIWVETQNLTSPSDVVRKVLAQVIQNSDERYDYPSNYDPTDDSWIVENQPGEVVYDSDSPAVNDKVTASITDNDGGLSNITYQWQELVSGNWQDISSQTIEAYTITTTGSYRCIINYDDNYGSGQVAEGETLVII